MQKNGIDAALITREPNILYFTGFRGGTYLLVPLDEEPTLYVYGVDYEAAREELSSIENKIAYARQFYNDSVLRFNNLITTIPGRFFAGKRKPHKYLEISVSEKAVPKVEF